MKGIDAVFYLMWLLTLICNVMAYLFINPITAHMNFLVMALLVGSSHIIQYHSSEQTAKGDEK